MVAVTDLYDDVRPPGSRWTRVNIGEAIPGVPTPLSWSIWKPTMEHAFWWSQIRLGVASAREYGRTPITTIAMGRPAISVDVTVAQVARLPGYDPDAFAEQYFGLPRGLPTPRSRMPPAVAFRAPLALATLGRRVARCASLSSELWSSPGVGGPLARVERAVSLFRDVMAVHTLQGLICQGVYERVASLAPDVAQRLVSTDGDLAEARVADDLWAWAHGSLTEREFLGRHGFHGPDEGEIASASWREDPAPVRATASAWASAPRSPSDAVAGRAADRREASASLSGPVAHQLVRAARRLVAQREVGKASFLRCLDVARMASRELGPDAVWCTIDELRSVRPGAAVLRARAARRAALAEIELPLSWVGDPEPIRSVGIVAGAGAVVRGLGVSPGVVEGRARIVRDASEPIEPGEILVTSTTDPSWVTLFLTAAAVVIDIGGALSHGAIVARELGIPCVIGTGDASARIACGALLRVDGTTGIVEVLATASGS